MSNFLLRSNGVLPVPIFITEPAIGYGLGVALLHFSLPDGADVDQSASPDGNPDGKTARPNITGIAGFATGTHSWGAAALHTHSWDDDRIRYTGIIGKINLQLSYYGVQQQARSYQLDGFAMFHELLFRLGESRWYVGPRYTFFDSHTRFDFGLPTDHGNFTADQRVAKGGLVTSYDSRDNNFYPSSGTYAQFVAEFARGGLGSTSDFEVQSAKAFHWMPLGERWVLGLRVDSGFSQGNIPFFAQPFVVLRGVPAAKYQDRNQLTTEVELRWNVTPDWSVLGFSGVGRAYGNLHSFSDAPVAYGFGAGFRYLLVRKIGLTMGIDIARGPGQNAFYIQIGSPWR
ncbi:BamA/TamA family outer membrane protein [Paraburkholderia humisilvae]|uniref:Bacterial surface antigen (D15) domain-containing protein n=2 Tax=Paraburkholderia humisilvae TaxID=627669 RepID=A0A6J5ETL4_9BURK|nr:BamA/TamA family outer membrane protein [Paraburkholderia humisilvae]CAB3768492.1 hypothetical protein LMG29542_05868 [Paraburkholderia humisilvae]